jgi:predicted amidophosphoribosyltransferase
MTGITDAAYPDIGAAARLVRAGKHGHWRAAGRFFGPILAARVGSSEVEVVTWVPADRGRRRRRGGCLPERTARAVARELRVPALALLDRRARSRSQRGRDRTARFENAAGSYIATGDRHHGRHVLLVDDIRTTGATLAAASAALAPGARSVRAVSITRVGGSQLVWKPRNERGISAHGRGLPCRYDRTRPRKGSPGT